jgi:hypothetical protein
MSMWASDEALHYSRSLGSECAVVAVLDRVREAGVAVGKSFVAKGDEFGEANVRRDSNTAESP